jgi:hypothetical protein
MLPADPHVEVGVTRTQAFIATCPNWTLGCMVVSIDLSDRKEIERMPAVVRKNQSQFEASQECILRPRTVEYARNDYLVTMVERRQSAIEAEVGRVLRSKVAVKVSGCVVRLAIGVVCEQHEVVAEELLYFEDTPVLRQNSMRTENSSIPCRDGCPVRLSLQSRPPRISPGGNAHAVYLYIYKDGGMRTFSRRYVGSD